MANVGEELARLAQLRDQGVLTEDEFQAQKSQLLANGNAKTEAPPPQTAKKGLGKGCAVAAVVLVGLAVVGIATGGGNGESGSSPPAAEATPPLPVTAAELFNAYQSNEAAAQQQYGDRPLLVSATVDGVDLDFSNKPVVKLKTPNQFMSAQANLTDASQAQASGLSPGQQVTLLCTGVSEVIGTPILKECAIQ